jgi:hypothetical protein
MSNPFAEHAQNTADYQDMLKGDGDGGAMLTLSLAPDVSVDCTFDRIMDDFNLVAGGQSPKLMIEGCKFMASDIDPAKLALVRKGLFCVLKPNPAAADVPCKLWMGGLEQGGFIFSFMLVDRNYSA